METELSAKDDRFDRSVSRHAGSTAARITIKIAVVKQVRRAGGR